MRHFPKDKHYLAFLRFINVAKPRGSGSRTRPLDQKHGLHSAKQVRSGAVLDRFFAVSAVSILRRAENAL